MRNFSITQLTDPVTGNLHPPGKAAKDNNFRSLTFSIKSEPAG